MPQAKFADLVRRVAIEKAAKTAKPTVSTKPGSAKVASISQQTANRFAHLSAGVLQKHREMQAAEPPAQDPTKVAALAIVNSARKARGEKPLTSI